MPGGSGAPQPEALWALLERQALAYTRWEIDSLPAEMVEELYRSLCFCIAEGKAAGEAGGPEAQLRAGQQVLYRRTRRAEGRLRAARQTARSFGNLAYTDTLAKMDGFFARYDIRFLAHQIPADIDYPLARPVPEDLLGVRYVEAWLAQLLLENRLVAAFPRSRVHLVPRAACPDPAGLLINLWEPVFRNALGLALLHQPPKALNVTPEQRTQLAPLCQKESLSLAAARLCNALGIWEEAPRELCRHMAAALAPHLKEAKDLAGVFVTLGAAPPKWD